jgi:hypothetical protein
MTALETTGRRSPVPVLSDVERSPRFPQETVDLGVS